MTAGAPTTTRSDRRSLLRVVTAVTAVTVVAVLAPALESGRATAAEASESYRVPDSGSFALSGLGYGHGIGMSQFGAEGMGRQGFGYREILSFYYPGTEVRTVPLDRTIRVALSGMTRREDGSTTLTVVPRSRLTATVAGDPVELPTALGGDPVDAYRVVRTADGLALRASAGTTTRRLWSGVGGPVTFATSARPGRSKVTLLSSGGSPRTYHGSVVVRRSSGLLVVDDLRLQDYLKAVVSLEIPGSWTPAALRAQAVAARSYALLVKRNARAAGQRYDICDTTSCQVFGSLATESANEVAAVADTAGEYLSADGEPAFTQFSSANGGYSVAGSRPYLVAQPDPYDGVVTGADNWGHSWEKSVTAQAIESAWPAVGTLQSIKVLARDGNGAWGGRVQSLALIGSAATVTVSGDAFRWGVGLKSTWWTVTNAGGAVDEPAPRSVRGQSLDRSLRVRWLPPATDRRVTGYVVTLQPGDLRIEVPRDGRKARFRGLVNGVEYRARVAAVYRSGRGERAGTGPVVPTSNQSYFRAVAPTTVWSGRDLSPVSDGGEVAVRVAGTDAVPLDGTRAVLLRVSVRGAAPGSAVAWPTGSTGSRLTAATFGRREPVTGTISVPVSPDGRVTVGTSAPARSLSVAVLGYYTSSGIRSWSFRATPATRVADSRAGIGLAQERLRDGATRWVRVAGKHGLPDAGVRAVLVNVALVRPRDDARLSLAAPDRPLTEGVAVRARAGSQRLATTVVRLDDRGRIPLRLSGGRAHVTVDVLGWFGPQDGTALGRFRTSDATLLDPQSDGPMGDGEVVRLAVAGAAGVPEKAHAVLLLVRAFGATGPGVVSLRPAGSDAPRRAAVAFDDRGATRNLVAVPVGAAGQVEVGVSGDAADVTVRVVGWYS